MLLKQLVCMTVVFMCAAFCTGCPNEPCGIRCRYGLAYDSNRCQLCQCLPNPCSLALCMPGTYCEAELDNECQDVGCSPYKAVCKI